MNTTESDRKSLLDGWIDGVNCMSETASGDFK